MVKIAPRFASWQLPASYDKKAGLIPFIAETPLGLGGSATCQCEVSATASRLAWSWVYNAT
jgi:hypothetical protein